MAWFEADMQKANANRDKVLAIATAVLSLSMPLVIFHQRFSIEPKYNTARLNL
jgi:hypothetical protein